jgi:type VI protein secretion system component VasF
MRFEPAMNRNRKFSAIEFVLLIAILGLVVGIGYYTWRMNNQRQATALTLVQKYTQQPQKTDEPIKEEA